MIRWLVLFMVSITSFAAEEPVVWAPVQEGKLVGSFRVTGRVVPLEGALTIQSARAAGRVVSILRHEGEKVKKGVPLLTINSAECITLEEESRVAREKHLQELIVSVDRRAAELDLKPVGGQCELVSSSEGTITRRIAEIGTAFNLGDALFQIVNTRHLTVELDVPEKDTQRIAVGKKVLISLSSDPGNEYATKISSIVPSLDQVTRTSRIRVAPFEFRRIPSLDAFASGEIETDSPEKSLLVPTSAVVFYQDKQWVLKQGEPEAKAVPVEVVSEVNNLCSLRAGSALKAGDKVLAKGAIYQLRKINSGKN